MHTTKTTLILGGTGKTGGRVAKRLRERGVPVRIGSRSGAPPFDWSRPETWDAALDSVDSVYLAYYPDLADPEAEAHVGAFAARASALGVKRIVLLSGRGEPQVLPSEEAVRSSGVELTILRAAWFSQNFSEGLLADAINAGELAFPAGDVAEPFIDVEDIADVAVIALTERGHEGKIYELTGPRLVTFAEAVAEIGRASDRVVRYVPVTQDAYAQALSSHVPQEVATFLAQLFGFLLDGHNAHVTDGIERVLGRRPRDFREYACAAFGP
ncbi:MAG: NmrA family transcriptional regulator [Polyangiaceae bacterium]|nr:NmrA family transcriptional regulator [Polyangiaceae bacterium]